MSTAPAIYRAIAAVQGDLAREGIGKDKRNAQQGYNFRGIDDVYNALAPLLAKHGLCVLPRCLAREQVERTSAKGGALFYTTVDVEFDFIAAEDGSKHTVRVPGEAMDSADKSTNKAMSAAYKYAAMQAFCIPTEGDNDTDATTHEVMPRQHRQEPAPRHDSVPLTDAHRDMMMTMLQKSGADVRAFCQYFGIGSVKELPDARFDEAAEMLERKVKRTAQARQTASVSAQASDILTDDIPY